ncbi:Sorting nexin-25 [Holothuria leucospilota]|uniref:Sorting nexin-25 n=1 Tax=Holothuria leucospilota TaxID=206669 RepID=A0A9Q1GZ27_HOLLE|nr:Sorting nexin-25 [Holothuria leucospilota]
MLSAALKLFLERTKIEFIVILFFQCSKWVKKAKLPPLGKRLSKSLEKKDLDKSKDALQRFLSAVLQDETLRQSEALFSLIIPTPKLLKDAPPVTQKKSIFSLSSIFKSNILRQEDGTSADDEEDGSSDRKDSIAEPLYDLISEIFELHGTFKWLRRSLIIFVQATFGGTINKEVQKAIDWICSEPMVLYYLHIFRDSMWPDGKWAGEARRKPEKEVVIETRKKARQKFLENLPDFLQNLLGKKNSRLGALKIFDAFQDSRTNKHIFYNVVEVLLIHLCPELRDPKLLQKLEEQDQRKLKSKQQKVGNEEEKKEDEDDEENLPSSQEESTPASDRLEDAQPLVKEDETKVENVGSVTETEREENPETEVEGQDQLGGKETSQDEGGLRKRRLSEGILKEER